MSLASIFKTKNKDFFLKQMLLAGNTIRIKARNKLCLYINNNYVLKNNVSIFFLLIFFQSCEYFMFSLQFVCFLLTKTNTESFYLCFYFEYFIIVLGK